MYDFAENLRQAFSHRVQVILEIVISIAKSNRMNFLQFKYAPQPCIAFLTVKLGERPTCEARV